VATNFISPDQYAIVGEEKEKERRRGMHGKRERDTQRKGKSTRGLDFFVLRSSSSS